MEHEDEFLLELVETVDSTPNDSELGAKVRLLVNKHRLDI